MFQFYIATFIVCFATHWKADSMRIVDLAGSKMKARPHASFPGNESSNQSGLEDAQVIMHIIGDTHGDNNYLLRCLESTKRIEVESTGGQALVRWMPGMPEDEQWKIVILGDIVDIGVRSRENLLILKSLSEDPEWGDRLVVLLGNHESKLLQALPDYADGPFFTYIKRMNDLYAMEGSVGHSLTSWLRQRPVVYFSHGLLMMHGGLSKLFADKVAKQIPCRIDCGHEMAAYMNNISHRFYEGLHQFYMSGSQDLSKWSDIRKLPDFLEDGWGEVGILSYRGWSSKEHGAGSASICKEAENVGAYLGSNPVMVVAHTTHPRIMQYCKDSKVPIFAVDTHPPDCSGKNYTACDYDSKHDTHPKYQEHDYDQTYQLPQSLKVTQDGGKREFAACYERNHDAYCTVLRTDKFDIMMDRSDTLSALSTLFDGAAQSDGSDLTFLSFASDSSDLSDSAEMSSDDGVHKRKRRGGNEPRKQARTQSQDVKESGGDMEVLTNLLGSWNPWLTLDDVDPMVASNSSVAVLASLRITPGTGMEFEDAFEEIAKGVREHEPQVTCFQLIRSRTDENAYEVMQIYSNLDALKNHMVQPHFLHGSKRIAAFVTVKPAWQTFSVVGTNGGTKP